MNKKQTNTEAKLTISELFHVFITTYTKALKLSQSYTGAVLSILELFRYTDAEISMAVLETAGVVPGNFYTMPNGDLGFLARVHYFEDNRLAEVLRAVPVLKQRGFRIQFVQTKKALSALYIWQPIPGIGSRLKITLGELLDNRDTVNRINAYVIFKTKVFDPIRLLDRLYPQELQLWLAEMLQEFNNNFLSDGGIPVFQNTEILRNFDMDTENPDSDECNPELFRETIQDLLLQLGNMITAIGYFLDWHKLLLEHHFLVRNKNANSSIRMLTKLDLNILACKLSKINKKTTKKKVFKKKTPLTK